MNHVRRIMMKAVVVYYSLEGNTQLIANMISEKTGADLFRLKPEHEFSKNGIAKYIEGGKSTLFHEFPKLTQETVDLESYDTVFIGTPIWAGTYASPLNSFFKFNQFANKNVYLFATHKGSGGKRCFAKLEEMLKGNQVVATVDFYNVGKMEAKEIQEKISNICNTIC